jgi:hypothetical protein
MISFLFAALPWLAGASLPAAALGLLAKLGIGWATNWASGGGILGLIGQPIIKLCVGLVDLLMQVANFLLRDIILKGLKVITGSVPAALTLGICVWGAYLYGSDAWRFWQSTEPPAISQPAPRGSTSKPTARPAPARCSDPLSACWWDNLFE